MMKDETKSRNMVLAKGTRNIIILGLISCFADISSEMVYPLIPLYLTAVFGATPALVGIIEGIAESVASLLKVFSGYISDRFQHKKAIAFSGYATGLLYKAVLLFAGSWGGILAARVIDRFGKGIRTAPRDVMVSESADKNNMGKAFGRIYPNWTNGCSFILSLHFCLRLAILLTAFCFFVLLTLVLTAVPPFFCTLSII